MRDTYSRDEVTAGRIARFVDDAYDPRDDYPSLADVVDDQPRKPAPKTLIERVETAVVWSGAIWSTKILRGATGIIEVPLTDERDRPDDAVAWLTREGLDAVVRDGILYVREAQPQQVAS